jgi:hypothetical protein
VATVARGRSTRLPQGRPARAFCVGKLCHAWRRLPGDAAWCWPLLSAAGPMVGEMESHGPVGWLILAGVFGKAGTAARSPRRRCQVLLRWLPPRLEIDAYSKALRSSTTLVWRCGRCYRGGASRCTPARLGRAFSASDSWVVVVVEQL